MDKEQLMEMKDLITDIELATKHSTEKDIQEIAENNIRVVSVLLTIIDKELSI